MAVWEKALAEKSDNLDLVPGSHVVEGENYLFSQLSSYLLVWYVAHTHVHTCQINKIYQNKTTKPNQGGGRTVLMDQHQET